MYDTFKPQQPMGLMDFVRAAKSCVKEIPPQALLDKLNAKEDLLLLDVREHGEYEAGHIKGAHLVPRGILEAAPLSLGTAGPRGRGSQRAHDQKRGDRRVRQIENLALHSFSSSPSRAGSPGCAIIAPCRFPAVPRVFVPPLRAICYFRGLTFSTPSPGASPCTTPSNRNNRWA